MSGARVSVPWLPASTPVFPYPTPRDSSRERCNRRLMDFLDLVLTCAPQDLTWAGLIFHSELSGLENKQLSPRDT